MNKLRNYLKYKKFKLKETGDIFYFQLNSVFKNEQFLSYYEVEEIDNEYLFKLTSKNISAPNNLYVINIDGEKILFNRLISKINHHSFSLIQLQEEQIPYDLQKKLDQFYNQY